MHDHVIIIRDKRSTVVSDTTFISTIRQRKKNVVLQF